MSIGKSSSAEEEAEANEKQAAGTTNRWGLPSMSRGGNNNNSTRKPESDNVTAKEETNETDGKQPSSSRWGLSLPNPMGMSASATKAPAKADSNPEQQDTTGDGSQPKASRWSLPALGASLKATTISSTNSSPNAVSASSSKEDVEDTYGAIPHLEIRGISVAQLQQLVQEMQHRCTTENWKSVETNQPLQPNQVSVYDLVKHYILPQTRANSCSFVEQAYGKHHYEHGLPRPPQWFVSHTWSDSVVDLVQCIERHAADRQEQGGDELTYWICCLAMNQHAVGAHVVADLDKLSDHSLLQDPRLTQKVLNVTQGMLAVIDRREVFFSRIWCLWELFLALERAKAGVGTGDLEDRYLLDVYTINEEGASVGLTSGVAEVDKYRTTRAAEDNANNNTTNDRPMKRHACHQSEWSELRAIRQSHFRFQCCRAAMDVNLETTHASLEEDTRRIMNYIVQNMRHDNPNEAEALTAHPAYAHVNSLVQGTFAGMAYRHALENSVNGANDGSNRLALQDVQRALLASPIKHLEVSFAGCASFQIREALKFVESLPTSLRSLDLDYSFLDFQYAEEFAIGLGRLGENLETFQLDLSFCSRLDNLDRLWEELGNLKHLRHLRLVVFPNKGLTSVDKLAAALAKMPHLESLHLEFDGFSEYSKMVMAAKSGATLNNISSTYRNMLGMSSSANRTQELEQQFDKVSRLSNLDLSGAYIADSSIQRLCRSLLSRSEMNSLRLRFLGDFGNKVKSVENVEDLRQKLQQVRQRLKLFS